MTPQSLQSAAVVLLASIGTDMLQELREMPLTKTARRGQSS